MPEWLSRLLEEIREEYYAELMNIGALEAEERRTMPTEHDGWLLMRCRILDELYLRIGERMNNNGRESTPGEY